MNDLDQRLDALANTDTPPPPAPFLGAVKKRRNQRLSHRVAYAALIAGIGVAAMLAQPTPTPTAPRCKFALPEDFLVGRRIIAIIGSLSNVMTRMSGSPITGMLPMIGPAKSRSSMNARSEFRFGFQKSPNRIRPS